jgi:hypothetical protein
MDGIIRIYEDTASNSEPAIEIGFTLGKHQKEELCFQLLKVLEDFHTNPNFERLEPLFDEKG